MTPSVRGAVDAMVANAPGDQERSHMPAIRGAHVALNEIVEATVSPLRVAPAAGGRGNP